MVTINQLATNIEGVFENHNLHQGHTPCYPACGSLSFLGRTNAVNNHSTEQMSIQEILSQSPAWNGALKIIDLLESAGHEAYIVGGSVRDSWLLLHTTTSVSLEQIDFDIATSAFPQEVMSLFHSTIPVGAQFGVVMVRIYESQYEVATFRQDLEYRDGRRPTGVRFATVEEDVLRRDFTINGLLYSPASDEMRDLVGGVADLEAKLIRTIGAPVDRFTEDKLRLIRAVRFAARFRFDIEKGTRQAIRELAPTLPTVSRERLRDELTRIMQDPHPDYALELLQECRLADPILQLFPEPQLALNQYGQLGKLKMEALPSELRLLAFLIFLACPLQNPAADIQRVQQTLRVFRLANSELTTAATICGHLFQLQAFDQLRYADRIRLLRDQLFSAAKLLAAALFNLPLGTVEAELGRLEGRLLFPPPLLDGQDLIDAGLEPGPLFKRILRELETRQLEGTLFDRATALELALQLAALD